MNRFYEIKYDKNIWNIRGNCKNGYRIVRKATLDCYFLNEEIFGIEQIKDDVFLIIQRITSEELAFKRLKLRNEIKIEEYNHTFRNFDFISDDIIIFDKDSRFSATLYSISKNCEDRGFEFFISKSKTRPDAHFCKSRKIKFVYGNHNKYPTYLQIDYELNSHYCKEFIQIFVDSDTLLPLSPVYSTLRKKYITLSDTFTLEMLFNELNDELATIDAFLHNLYYSDSKKTETELCSEILNH